MDGDGWSDGHLALFDALETICKAVGEETAAELAKSVAKADGRSYVQELERIRAKAAQVEHLKAENERLQFDLNVTHDHLEKAEIAARQTKISTAEAGAKSGKSDNHYKKLYEALVLKHNALVVSHRHMKDARDKLQDALRKRIKERDDWIAYADGQSKKVKKQEALLRQHGLLGSDSSNRDILPLPQQVVKNLIGAINVEKSPRRSRSGEPPGLWSNLSISPSSSELDGRTLINTSEMQALIMSGKTIPNISCLSREQTEDRTVTDNQLINNDNGERLSKVKNQIGPLPNNCNMSSPAHHSSSTQGEPEENPHDSATTNSPSPAVKVESPDSPVLLYTRCVRKRNFREPLSHSSTVKVEEVPTISPKLSLIGANHVDPHESMDLDDIGEKVDTPKKKRKENEHGNRLGGNTYALQPLSPNKQVLPRTTEGDRPVKRKRLDDRMKGAEILAEDGENEDENEYKHSYREKTIRVKPNVGVQLSSSELGKRLTGLLEHPSPQRHILSPARISRQSTVATPLEHAKEATDLRNSRGKLAVNGTKRPSVSTIVVTPPQRVGSHSTLNDRMRSDASILKARVKAENGQEADDTDKEPFRLRPVHRLGLEHFKVNPNFNGGYDYAFNEVVRGRERRKCLPGCTKPECCGDTFRKIVESTMVENSTLSQEEKNQRLLEEYMGANKHQVHAMTKEDREEMLIQAKMRELANKAGKHRHAFERRRSPPGFWRSDFPNTQESEADRAEAKRMTRQLVQLRYDEAMRAGGKWKFADE